jgi:hypothetical protein
MLVRFAFIEQRMSSSALESEKPCARNGAPSSLTRRRPVASGFASACSNEFFKITFRDLKTTKRHF